MREPCLYPRTLDDPFPGKAIDYTQKREMYAQGEFAAFVAALRSKIADLQQQQAGR